MASIGIAVYEERPTIISAGIQSICSRITDVEPCFVYNDEDSLLFALKNRVITVVFLVVNSPNDRHFGWIGTIRSQHDVRVLIAAVQPTRDMVFRAVKSGANGFIAADTPEQEIREAVFTMRSGHEFFSSSITSLLVSNYVEAIRSEGPSQVRDIDLLSKRELEILTMWGEGHSNANIADRLFISIRTVETHKNHIMQKLGMSTTVDLLKFAIRKNLISL